MEMQDRPQEGVAWVAGLEHAWGACNNFAYHIHWHRCLFLLDQGDAAAVLRHYDSDVRGDQSEEYLDISNAVALLWRLRSEEHTSGLQSLMRISYAVFCLKKKNNT